MQPPPGSEGFPPLPPSPPPYSDSARGEGRFHVIEPKEFSGGVVFFQLQQDTKDLDLVLSGQKEKQWADNGSSWVAALDIHCKDIFALMKQGLYFSQENVDPIRSRILAAEGINTHLKNLGYSHLRRYTLVDHAEDPKWWGTLEWLPAR